MKIDALLQHISCRSRNVCHDRLFRSAELVKQRRLSGVWLSKDYRLDAFRHDPSIVCRADQLLDHLDPRFIFLFKLLRITVKADMFRIIQCRLNICNMINDLCSQILYFLTDASAKLADGTFQSVFIFCLNDIHHRLRLRQIHSSI